MYKWLIVVFVSVLTLSAHAGQFKTIKNSEIHYSAFNSTFLTADVARQYQLKRNGHSAILNISVLDNAQLGKPAIEAQITGHARNLIGQMRQLDFKQIKEGNAIYYLAEFAISDEEELTFQLDINAGQTGSGKMNFKQKFYVEP